jgi:hypothetical protein
MIIKIAAILIVETKKAKPENIFDAKGVGMKDQMFPYRAKHQAVESHISLPHSSNWMNMDTTARHPY